MGTLGRAFYSVGFWIRETGQALDRLGCRLQGKNYFREQRKILRNSIFHSDFEFVKSEEFRLGNSAHLFWLG